MSLVSIKRVLRAGLLDFWRNGFVSFASVLMMVFTLLIIGLAMFSGVILNVTFEELQDKSNMSVTFLKDAPEERVLELKSALESLPEVANVTHATPEEVLASFRERYQDDQLTLQSLEELGGNPFGAKLTIDAREITQYDRIANFLKEQAALTSAGPSIIDEINYFDPRYHEALTRLQNITESGRSVGLVI
ncbi:MAG TPA: permease-like cell division protein FtsX, partial [Candidatus Paceibacterota bacterium]|nr:permease-like cell division protein FtsX [Candidatus Paceibacterota bacterium]